MVKWELGLYKLAKYTNLEIVMESQVLSSGANQARLLEKYKKNKGAIKQQAIAMKFAFAVMLFFTVGLPIITYIQVIISFNKPSITPESVLLPGSILFGAYFFMQVVYLTMLGMFPIGAMMSGDAFRWYETLPISKNKLRKLGFMTVLHNMDIGLIIMILSFPIIIFVMSFDLILTLIATMLSILNVLFSFSILVLIAGRISRVLKVSEAASKKATLIRVFTMLAYIIAIFSASFLIQWVMISAGGFFSSLVSSEVPYGVKFFMAIIPFPFAPGFFMTMVINPTSFSLSLWLTVSIGMILFALLTLFTYRKALKAMRTVTSSASLEIKYAKPKKKIHEKSVEVTIDVRTPIKAYMRKDLSTATRDIQTFMFIIMPFILPMVVLIALLFTPTGLGESFIGGFIVTWLLITMYQPMISMMLTSGFLNMEDTGASILSSLPIRTRDQAKAKLILLGTIQTISYFLPLTLFIGNPDFWNYLMAFISYYPVILTLLISMFQMKIRFFGRMKYKFVVEELNPEKKIKKWAVMIIVEYLIFFAFNIMGGIMLIFGPSMMFLANFIGGALALGVLLLSFNSMFPKVLGKKRTISIRELMRKYPLFGTLIILPLYAGFLFLPGLIELPLLPFIEHIPFIVILFVDFIVTFSVMALLWMYVVRRLLGLPNEKESIKDYIKTIGLKTDKKLVRNIFLGIGCSIIYFTSTYITGNILGDFVLDFDVIFGTPGRSVSIYGWFLFILMLIPGIWEEVSFRGVFTTMNLRKYSRTKVIIFVSILFGLFHFLNLLAILAGYDLVLTGIQVILQVIYASLLGSLLGYLFIKTKSLIPSIILHYLIDSLGRLFTYGSFDSVLNFLLFTIIGVGIIPTVLGILLVKLTVREK
ncbi:MAG: CPBP family intramembrane metalloprotease [Candidatus Lokiarchaeota archaeon]|nr:CPBP family intramembrane metalloprotease [Candidatus Lokiarchaeota archaeon]